MYKFDDTSLSEWLSYLERLHPVEIDMGLFRIKQVYDAMGHQPAFPIVTVAGTNGKGSVCAILSHILCAAGYRTGTYTSPHLHRYNERVKINLREVTDDALLAAFHHVRAACGRTTLTYFEFGTLAAMQIFMNQHVDIAILEVGLGGRLDAVNVFEPKVSAVVSIGIDHESYLGNTRELIGLEKAGVYRPGKPAFCADPEPPQSLIDHANRIGADLRLLGRNYGFDFLKAAPVRHRVSPLEVVVQGPVPQWTWWGHTHRYTLPYPALKGPHQIGNTALALALLEEVTDHSPVDLAAIKQGLIEVKWPGRLEILPGLPMTILDVGHNPHAALVLRASLNQMPTSGKTLAVFGMMEDKDIASVVRILGDLVDIWHLATLNTPRAASAQSLTDIIHATLPQALTIAHNTVADAWCVARGSAKKDDRILVFGSFYTVAGIT